MFHEFIPRFTLTRTSALPLMSLPHGLLRCGFWLPAPPNNQGHASDQPVRKDRVWQRHSAEAFVRRPRHDTRSHRSAPSLCVRLARRAWPRAEPQGAAAVVGRQSRFFRARQTLRNSLPDSDSTRCDSDRLPHAGDPPFPRRRHPLPGPRLQALKRAPAARHPVRDVRSWRPHSRSMSKFMVPVLESGQVR